MHEGERDDGNELWNEKLCVIKGGWYPRCGHVTASRVRQTETVPRTCISCFINARRDPGTVFLIAPSAFWSSRSFILSLSMRLVFLTLELHSGFSLSIFPCKCSPCPLSLAPYLGSVKLRCSLTSISRLRLTATFIYTLTSAQFCSPFSSSPHPWSIISALSWSSLSSASFSSLEFNVFSKVLLCCVVFTVKCCGNKDNCPVCAREALLVAVFVFPWRSHVWAQLHRQTSDLMWPYVALRGPHIPQLRVVVIPNISLPPIMINLRYILIDHIPHRYLQDSRWLHYPLLSRPVCSCPPFYRSIFPWNKLTAIPAPRSIHVSLISSTHFRAFPFPPLCLLSVFVCAVNRRGMSLSNPSVSSAHKCPAYLTRCPRLSTGFLSLHVGITSSCHFSAILLSCCPSLLPLSLALRGITPWRICWLLDCAAAGGAKCLCSC